MDIYEKETFKKIRSKIVKKRKLNHPNTPSSEKHTALPYSSQEDYERQLTVELAYPRLEKYSSEVLTTNLKVAVENTKTPRKEEVIVHSKSRNEGVEPTARRRKLSIFQASFEGTRGCIENNWCPCARHRSSTCAPPSRSTTGSARASSSTSRRTRTQSPPSDSNSPSTRRNSAPKDSQSTKSGDHPSTYPQPPLSPLSSPITPPPPLCLPRSSSVCWLGGWRVLRWIIFIDAGGAGAANRGVPNLYMRLDLEKTLGQGTFGKVKLAIHERTGEKVAVKVLEKKKIVDVSDIERVSREIHILKLVRHPNLIQLYEIIETPKYLFLVMEYCGGGELFDYIAEQKKYPLPHLGSPNARPAGSSIRSSTEWTICTASASSIATSSLKTCCLTTTKTSKSSTSDSPIPTANSHLNAQLSSSKTTIALLNNLQNLLRRKSSRRPAEVPAMLRLK